MYVPHVCGGDPAGTIITQSEMLPGPLLTPTAIVDPGGTVAGLLLPLIVRVGPDEAGVTPKPRLEDVPPPGAGETTVIAFAPTFATSVAGSAAVSRVDEMNIVVRGDPSTRTSDP